MVALDTNVILRLLLQDVPDQSDAAYNLITQAKPGSLAVADIVIFECVWVLAGPLYSQERDAIADMLLTVIRTPSLNCNRTLFERALPLYAKHPKLSFSDVCIATYAELNDALPLLTLDKALAKAMPKVASPNLAGVTA